MAQDTLQETETGRTRSFEPVEEHAAAPSSSFGIGAKLFIAFCALAGLTALASAVAWYVFGTVDRSVTRLTGESIPSMAASLRLAEKSAEIAATAPSIMASTKQEERVLERAKLEQRARELADLIEGLKTSRGADLDIAKLEQIARAMTAELTRLDAAVAKRLRAKSQQDAAVTGLAAAHAKFIEMLEPRVDDSVFDLVIRGEKATTLSSEVIANLVEGGTSTIHHLLTINAEGNLAAGLLAEAAHIFDPALIQPVRERFAAAAAAVERSLRLLPERTDRTRLAHAGRTLLALGAGADSLFDIREQELRAIADAKSSLQKKREHLVGVLKTTHDGFLTKLIPMVDDATFELVLASETVSAENAKAVSSLVEGGVSSIYQLLTINAEGNLAAGLLGETAHSSDIALIQPARERFEAAAAAVERNLRQLPERAEKMELAQSTRALLALGTGTDNLFDVRERELKAIAALRVSLQNRRQQLTSALKSAHEGLLAELIPMVDDAAFDLVLTSETVSAENARTITDLIDLGVNRVHVLLAVRAEGNLAAGLLNEAAGIQDASRLQPLSERFIAAASRIDRLLNQFSDAEIRDPVREASGNIVDFGMGGDSIFGLRRDELSQIAAARTSLQSSRLLAVRLGNEVTGLLKSVKQNSDMAALLSATAIGNGKLLIMIVTATSILGAILVLLFYVRPRIVGPLESITAAMSELASGDTTVDIPGRDRGDEMGRMARALGVFRDTAIEVQESNLQEIRETRRRLSDAIETISEGFSLYDGEDRLVIFNSKYRELLYPGIDIEITPGMTFESLIRRAAEQGYVTDAANRVEEWLESRMARHRDPGEPHIHQRGDGRWIMVSERRTEDGGTVAVYSDITELKQREQELAEKSHTMETLSNQLAKYLSPQVYDSIFTGKKEVKVASHRQKLTVFFSDIAGFTETADRLESEELSRLLNHYLTEMSRIALQYGATIDKYVGDAIVIFFGDPETMGVKEDALACVKMAIAMRNRMEALQDVWRASGTEKPLQCRMGINTGYCTVGNFGSEDRMDYTIIGGGVNLASRLESASKPGAILISYETYAHVKDEIHCEQRGELKVKGIAYPVAVYHVVDAYENLGQDRELIREHHPNFKLDVDLDVMSSDQIEQALTTLRRALDRVSDFGDGAKPRAPRSAERRATSRRARKSK